MKINRSSLYSVIFIIVLVFSLFGTQGQAIAETAHERNLASGVPYNVGDLFVGGGGSNEHVIKHFSPTGILLDELGGVGLFGGGLAFDFTGNLYVTCFFCGPGAMEKYDNQGNLVTPSFGSGFNESPIGVVVNAAGYPYVGQSGGSKDVLKFDANGTLVSSFDPAVENSGTDQLDLAADQCTLLYTSRGILIKRFNVCTNTQLPDFALLPISIAPLRHADELRIRPNGEVMVSTVQDVLRLDASGTIIQTYPKPMGAEIILDFDLDPDLTSFWILTSEPGNLRNVYKIDITSGAILQSFNLANSSGTTLAIFQGITEPQLQITPVTATKTVGESVALAGFLTNCLNTNVFVTFTVTGANPQTGTGLASCDQIITGFSYTGVNPGIDTIVATAHTTMPPANLTSNTSTITWNTLQAVTDLSITKSDAPDPVMAGDTLSYGLTVTNNGSDDATGVTVTDTLPIGVTFDPATSSPGCTEAGNVVTCSLGDLANGASTTVTINVNVDPATPAGIIINTASVTGNETDPDTANNTASTETLIMAPPISCPILDDFNRPNGPLGSNWDGRTRGYRILNNEIVVRAGGPIYWQPEAYGPDQEACVRLTRINPKSRQHALLLKVQELNNWRQGAILVSYNARSGNIDVEARDVITKKWNLVGSFNTPVMDGDQLRAQAFADGTVEVFVNNISIGTADAGSFYADKGGQIGLWFLRRQGDDDGDKDNDRESLIQARERNSNGDDEHEDDDDDSSTARRAILDDFGGGTIITTPPLTLTQICSDSFTNVTSQHKTQAEPDTFSNGSTIVSAQQTGRFFSGGASNICWSTTTNNGTSWVSGSLPGITKHENAANPFDRVSDPAVAYDAKHNVWMISTLAVLETPGIHGAAVLTSRSTDGGLTWGNPVTVVTGANLDKNWIACDNTSNSPFYGNCYTEWDDAGSGAMLQMSTSSDGGLTWGSTKKVGTGANIFHGLGGQPVVQPNGTVIVPYTTGFNVGSEIRAFLSTNGGTSWDDPFLVSNVTFHDPGDPGDDLRVHALPSVEIDAAGKVYVVWPDCRFRSGCTSNDLVMSTSTDGMSWTSPIRIPIGTITDGTDNFIPGIAVDNTTSGATAKVAITYYYYPVASCTFATCQLHVGFISSPDGGANWTGVTTLAGPMTLSWLPNTSQGRMVGDYISTSYGSDGLAHGVFAIAKEPTGNPDCAIATPNCDQATYSTSSGLALSTMSNTVEALIAAEVGVPQPPVLLNIDEDVPDQTNLTLY